MLVSLEMGFKFHGTPKERVSWIYMVFPLGIPNFSASLELQVLKHQTTVPVHVHVYVGVQVRFHGHAQVHIDVHEHEQFIEHVREHYMFMLNPMFTFMSMSKTMSMSMFLDSRRLFTARLF
jgi:hypothetical protein